MRKSIPGILFSIPLLIIFLISCQDDHFSTDQNLRLDFSVDTLRFDTVFTSLGSATRVLKVYNRHSEPIRISTISLASMDQSQFRLNIDGEPASVKSGIEIAGSDSLYIFVEVTVNPDLPLSESPFIIEEELYFELNGNEQIVLLEAWGQNANYIPSRSSAGTLNLLSCDLSTIEWSDPKPYVIYGILFIDSCHVVFPPGTEIYVHGGVARIEDDIFNDGLIVVLERGKISSAGTVDQPVIIQGDRLESAFGNVPGQWSGIRLTTGSKQNLFQYTTIKNSMVGLRADSASSVQLKNVRIENTSGSGLIGVNADIRADNCLIHSNGNFGAVLSYGGKYEFYYTTIANYGNQASALRLDNFRCTDPQCQGEILVSRLNAQFTNCIISGSSSDEIDLEDALEGSDPEYFVYSFAHCIVQVDELLDAGQFPNFFDSCENCINSEMSDTLFINVDEANFHLDTMSIAEMKGIPVPFIGNDLENNPRDPVNPDIGCYEFQE